MSSSALAGDPRHLVGVAHDSEGPDDVVVEAFMARRFERTSTVVETSVALSRLEREGAPPSENVSLMKTAFETLAKPY